MTSANHLATKSPIPPSPPHKAINLVPRLFWTIRDERGDCSFIFSHGIKSIELTRQSILIRLFQARFGEREMASDSSLAKIINYSTYPIADTDSAVLKAVIERARHKVSENGIALLPNFMLPSAIRETIADTEEVLPNAFRGISDHNVYLEDTKDDLEPQHPGNIISRSTKSCVTHDQIKPTTPLNQLYMSSEMTNFIRLLLHTEVLYRTADPLGALNIQVYKENDQLNWHFDRGEFAVTLLLQSAEAGGHFQYSPSTR